MKSPVPGTMALPTSNGFSHSVEQASKLLDFSQKLDIDLLDHTVSCLYSGEGQEVSISGTGTHIYFI